MKLFFIIDEHIHPLQLHTSVYNLTHAGHFLPSIINSNWITMIKKKKLAWLLYIREKKIVFAHELLFLTIYFISIEKKNIKTQQQKKN